jgi:phosphatidylserine/phosphatidylglycerophosphate/cardiolipin synthase-like enzyme
MTTSPLRIVAVANCDDVALCWRPVSKIPNCLGFAVERRVEGGSPEYLLTELPFAGASASSAAARSSAAWPIQRFCWTDHLPPKSARLQYRVGPVFGDPTAPEEVAEELRSPWSDVVECTIGGDAVIQFYPNRGIVASPWIEKRLAALAEETGNVGKSPLDILKETTSTAGDALREALAGPVLVALKTMFAAANIADEHIYAALYELQDSELIDMLISAADRCHLVLANGSFDEKHPDPNLAAATQLASAGIEVHRRLVRSPHFAHNKFVAFTGTDGTTPERVWTGSTNWTPSGLCTQSNHAVVINDPALTKGYLEYWTRLRDAGSDYPDTLAATDSTPTQAGPELHARAWYAPVNAYVDLSDARSVIAGAQSGALFLMFRPGNTNTLIDDLEKLHTRGLFVRGVVNKDFLGPNSAAAISFFNGGGQKHADPELVLPDYLRRPVAGMTPELSINGVLIHSKTIVLDPFGSNPVVITGSHNLGEKASKSNDDNLVIIEGQSNLAAQFAVYIMNVYDHYKWRYEKSLRTVPSANDPQHANDEAWAGLSTTDAWQSINYLASTEVEAGFWFGSRA